MTKFFTEKELKEAAEFVWNSPLCDRTPMALDAGDCFGLKGVHLHLKMEYMQKSGSFKMRGAAHQIHKLTTESLAKGISTLTKPRFVTWSGGNYGKAFALANKHMGNEGLVCIAETAPIARRSMLQSLGMQVKAAPVSELRSLVKWHEENEGMIRAEPFDDLSLIAAYSSITYEIVEALNGKPPDFLLAPVGGGGLISGIAAALRLAGTTKNNK